MLPHDAACKLLFSFPAMVRDLLAGFVPQEWADELDLSTLERWPESTVSEDLRQRHQDRVWRVRLRDRWLYVLVLLEFQSTVDRTMAVRVLAYTALLYQDLLRVSSDPLPPVLPIVLHHGRERWTAPEDVAGLAAPPVRFSHPISRRSGTFCLMSGAILAPCRRGAIWWRACSAGAQPQPRGRGDGARGVGGVAVGAGARGVEACVRGVDTAGVSACATQGWGAGAAAGGVERGQDHVVRDSEGMDGRVAGTGPGRGRAEGRAQVMRRQAARKFGAVTADRLAEELERVNDPERTVEIGEWLIECESGDELLDRVRRMCRTAARPAAEDGADAASP